MRTIGNIFDEDCDNLAYDPASTLGERIMAMQAAARLTVDLGAIAANYRLLAQRAAPAIVAGVVKADGYGLGAIPVARTLIAQGCRHLFVALLTEAEALLPHVGDVPVYVLNGLLPGAEADCARIGAVPVINSLDQAHRWAEIGAQRGKSVPAVIQMDTGMSRLGFPEQELQALLKKPDLLARFDIRLLMSHLACADEPAAPANPAQEQAFRAIARQFPSVPLALDNSGGTFLDRTHFDLVRAGIALYGGAPSEGPNPMSRVASLETWITQVRDIAPGTGVGYGLTFTAPRPMRIATIPVGYADGWPRALSNRGAAYIAGHRTRIVGRVSMDSITLDVTDVPVPHLFPGAAVELLGPNQSLDQVAADAGTISYEILTQLSRRYDRTYLAAQPPQEGGPK